MHFWKAWGMSNKHSSTQNSKFDFKGLKLAQIWPIFESEIYKLDIWIPGKILSEILVHNIFGCLVTSVTSKGICFYETRQKIFRLLGGKIKFELALQPNTASTAKIQFLFSRQGV